MLIHPYTCGRLREERSLISLSMFNAAIICNASEEDLAWLEQAKPLLPIVLYNRHSEGYCTCLLYTSWGTSLFSSESTCHSAGGDRRG